MVENWMKKSMRTIFVICYICNMQYFSYDLESNTRTIIVWKRHGTSHKLGGRKGEAEQQWQKEMDPNNKKENASRTNYDYKVGDKLLLKKPGKHLRKLEAHRTGPHTTTDIYNNGTLRIK
jgi:hypothetical protein